MADSKILAKDLRNEQKRAQKQADKASTLAYQASAVGLISEGEASNRAKGAQEKARQAKEARTVIAASNARKRADEMVEAAERLLANSRSSSARR